jgi:hypothetical protein
LKDHLQQSDAEGLLQQALIHEVCRYLVFVHCNQVIDDVEEEFALGGDCVVEELPEDGDPRVLHVE